MLGVTGCVSTGESSYGNAVGVSYAGRDKAAKNVKKLRREATKLKKKLKKAA